MAGGFADAHDEFARTVMDRFVYTHRRASELLFEEANLAIAKGGKMPVDSGFLRSSFRASLSGMPIGPLRMEDGSVSEANITVVIAQAGADDTIWGGWTAAYARRQEYEHHGFARSAADNWQAHVAAALSEAWSAFP